MCVCVCVCMWVGVGGSGGVVSKDENEEKWQGKDVRVTGTQSTKVVLTRWPGKEAQLLPHWHMLTAP